ncbi:MAG: hypothetical protein ABJF10_16360 [Chthoniobacter sp.]|uniref:hypothetical protein n=1 Tax=Chthoniobacter sp. TaxID=2510640 RepID=UPI0032A9DA14
MKSALWLVLAVCVAVSALRAAPEAPATPAPAAAAPFRLVFKSYDGDPRMSNDFKKFSFQIDTIDLRQPSEFLQVGQMIPNTQLKLSQFAFKEAYDAKLQESVDVSELTVVNVITGKPTVLPLNKVVNVSGIYSPPARANK